MQINKQLKTLNQDIAGQAIGIPVYEITPDEPSDGLPVVYIQSAVHAAEMQGSAVIQHLIERFKALTLRAKFVLVPNCNPFGRTQRAGEYLQGRFDATTGNNWNRFYHYSRQDVAEFVATISHDEKRQLESGDEEQLIAKFKQFQAQKLAEKFDSEWGINTAQYLNTTLQQLAVPADLVLDLHTGPSSTRHIYSPEFLAESAKLFNIENIISIPESFAGALDEASFTPWCQLSEDLADQGIEFQYRVKAFTVELGSQENICLAQAKQDAEGILNYLQSFGYIEGFAELTPTDISTTLLKDYRTLFSKHAGMVEYVAKAGDKVKKGQLLARVLNSLEFENGEAVIEICSPADGTIILHYPSAAVQVGTQLYKIAIDN